MKSIWLKFSFILVFASSLLQAEAQEVNATVTVNSLKLGGSDKQFYQQMQQNFQDFINNRKWTTDQFQSTEKVEFTVTIILEKRPANDQFNASIQVSYARPIFGSGYTSPIINLNDQHFDFVYQNSQDLFNFTESTYTNNLTSILSFYTLLVLGIDYDTYSMNGGNPFYIRAQNIANAAQTQSDLVGWKTDELRNRYWLINDLTNSRYSDFHKAIYTYHRLGLDAMAQDVDAGRGKLAEAVSMLYRAYKDKPGSYFLSILLNTKSTELANAFGKGSTQQKTLMAQQLSEMDVTNQNKYQTILRPN